MSDFIPTVASVLPLLQVEPVKKTLTEGTLFYHKGVLVYNNLPSSHSTTQTKHNDTEHVMDANGSGFMR